MLKAQSLTPQPLGFKLLSFLNLKNILLQKILFNRSNCTYQLRNNIFYMEGQRFDPPNPFTFSFTTIRYEGGSVPMVHLQRHPTQIYPTVIYSHGNSSDLSSALLFISRLAIAFPNANYVAYDYSGYGLSEVKTVSQESLSKDLTAVYQHVQSHTKGNIILWGFSLGSYPTIKVAASDKSTTNTTNNQFISEALKYTTQSRINTNDNKNTTLDLNRLRAVVLQSPLLSLYSIFAKEQEYVNKIQNDMLETQDQMQYMRGELLILHSVSDEVVPFWHSQRLLCKHKALNPHPATVLTVQELKHNEMHRALITPTAIFLRFALLFRRLLSNMSKAETFRNLKKKYFDEPIEEAVVVEVDRRVGLEEASVASLAQTPFRTLMTQYSVGEEALFQGIQNINPPLQLQSDRRCFFHQQQEPLIISSTQCQLKQHYFSQKLKPQHQTAKKQKKYIQDIYLQNTVNKYEMEEMHYQKIGQQKHQLEQTREINPQKHTKYFND